MPININTPFDRAVRFRDHSRFCADLADAGLDELRDMMRALQIEAVASRSRLSFGASPHVNPRTMDGWINPVTGDAYVYSAELSLWVSGTSTPAAAPAPPLSVHYGSNPPDPAPHRVWIDPAGATYLFDQINGLWISTSGVEPASNIAAVQTFYEQEDPPLNPVSGWEWFKPSEARRHVYQDDAWVEDV